MSREIKRVPLDFDWPVGERWSGYLMPDRLREGECESCGGSGYSPDAEKLKAKWYGNASFDPAETGSARLTASTPEVRAFAERNVAQAPEFYGQGEPAIVREAQRLADLWNGMWAHHLEQVDVDALVAGENLIDFTHRWVKGEGWVKLAPEPQVIAAAVNAWSLRGMGHDSGNCYAVIRAKCERLGVPLLCATCEGEGSVEEYPGQRAEAEAWTKTDPPTGDGWQAWSTTTEGHPCSPVFAAPDELVAWAVSPDGKLGIGGTPVTEAAARAFIGAGWAPSMISTPETGLLGGVEALGVTSSA